MKKLLSIWMAFVLIAVPVLTYANAFPAHAPYGTGIGAMPGRVVWAHEPDAVDWDGNGYWWQTEHFDEQTILRMVNASVATLGGKASAQEGWDALFTDYNQRNGSARGYQRGEKIAIKANINGSAVFEDDTSGETQMSYTNPVLLKTLLLSLVEQAGVLPSDITVYDVSRLFPDYMVEMCTEGVLQGVRFVDRNTGVPDEQAAIAWSYDFEGLTNYLPTCVTEAAYVINLANLKGHSYGITLCGKNHFGSFINGNSMRPPEGANLHQFLTRNEMGIYSPLVDLMANEQLGAKTVLYMLDAIICAPSEGASITGENARWQQAPFDGDYTSSIFVSQDPVAIDSVGADFLMNEPTVAAYNSAADDPDVENYLHEAGQVANPPSGTVYQNGQGERVSNLGVHEHWNNAEEKQYSRNLGRSEGIELVMAETEDDVQISVENDVVTVSGAPENSTLITAFYQGNLLSDVQLYKGSGTITADLTEGMAGADRIKLFLWDMESLRPLAMPTEVQQQNQGEDENQITLTVNGQSFAVTLYDNETAEQLKNKLPMTLHMEDVNGNEKYTVLPDSLPTATETPGTIHAGDLMLYGTNGLVLFYETFQSSYSYTRIGSVADAEQLQAILGDGDVTVELHV